MSPILIRPVREQLEHDRLIRHLATKYKKKYEVNVNIGDEQVAPIKIGPLTLYPDVLWTDGKRLAGLAEVETSESVNNLEAMAQWAHFSRVRVPFHLYVPVQGYDAARRLCEANQAKVSEIWTYRASLDGFDLVRMYVDSTAPPSPPPMKKASNSKPLPVAAAKPVLSASKPAAPAKSAVVKPSSKPVKAVKSAKPSKPVTGKPARTSKGGSSKSSAGGRTGRKPMPAARRSAPKAPPRKIASSVNKKKGAAGRGR